MAIKKTCLNCSGGFISRRSDALYCSQACRQRARRGRGDKCDTAVTDKTERKQHSRRRATVLTLGGGRSAEAVALLAALDAEAAQNAEDRGDPPLADGEDDWTAAERAVLEMIACAVDRKVDLWAHYLSADDAKLQIKLSGELRLLEANIARLLKQVKTDLPPETSRVSQKASNAAKVRWRGPGSA